MFNYKQGTPVAQIKPGKKIVYVSMEAVDRNPNKYDLQKIVNEVVDSNVIKRNRPKASETLMSYLQRGKEPVDSTLKPLYDEILKKVADMKEVIFDSCQPIPNPDERECVFISAPSGAGKTTWAVNYIEQFHKLFPDRGVFVISRVESDKVLDDLDYVNRIVLDSNFISDPVTNEELANSLVLFDDCATIIDKVINGAVQKLMNDVLETGRHHNIYCLITYHQSTDYKNTRKILNECSKFVVFPGAGAVKPIRYLLTTYVGLDNASVTKLLAERSRWMLVCRHAPQYALFEHSALILK